MKESVKIPYIFGLMHESLIIDYKFPKPILITGKDDNKLFPI